MKPIKLKRFQRARRKIRVRKRVTGTAERPRVSVFRSLKHIYVQAIDDVGGRTLAAASTTEKGFGSTTGNRSAAEKVGTALAEKLKAQGVGALTLDRNGFRYHGRIKALADAMRKAGLNF
jgi:large subunit ribosomal protein L18